MTRRLERALLAIVVVAGAFAVCAGIPAGTVWAVAHLGWGVLPSLLVAAAGLAAMAALTALLARADHRRAALGDPLPDGLQPGSVLLEASLVIALVVTVAAGVVLLARR